MEGPISFREARNRINTPKPSWTWWWWWNAQIFFGLQDLEDKIIVNYFLRIIGNFLIFVTVYYSRRSGSLQTSLREPDCHSLQCFLFHRALTEGSFILMAIWHNVTFVRQNVIVKLLSIPESNKLRYSFDWHCP
jgi:hypothetical protein